MIVRRVENVFEDERGWIRDVLEDEPIQHVSLIHSAKGSVRGNHLHRETYQWVYLLSGSFRYVVEAANGELSEGVISTGDLLLTEPLDKHALETLEDATMIVLTRGPRGGRNYEADTVRLETPLIPPR